MKPYIRHITVGLMTALYMTAVLYAHGPITRADILIIATAFLGAAIGVAVPSSGPLPGTLSPTALATIATKLLALVGNHPEAVPGTTPVATVPPTLATPPAPTPEPLSVPQPALPPVEAPVAEQPAPESVPVSDPGQ